MLRNLRKTEVFAFQSEMSENNQDFAKEYESLDLGPCRFTQSANMGKLM
jgi:hypothetical protein